MKTQLRNVLSAMMLLIFPVLTFAQAPPLGTAADFVLFSTNGAVTNSGISHLTGNVGSNSGSATGFGNVNGVMHDPDGTTATCSADLLNVYNLLSSAIPTFTPAPALGNGAILAPGVYAISGASTLNMELTLDAAGDANAVFIFQIQGAFSSSANSKVKLINGAKACNVFWKIEGLVELAAGTIMKGTVIANNAAIIMGTGVKLEGRALSTGGAITLDGILAYTPIGCESPVLTGPAAPNLASAECYVLFSSGGATDNTGTTIAVGDIGTNVGLVTGFDPLNVAGTIHGSPDVSTAVVASDLLHIYDGLYALPADIELLYPAQFGNSLVLTPHTYVLNGATTFTDTLILNAQGNANAVFVLKMFGALSTSTNSYVKLINGTQSKNVFWVVNGAVQISTNSNFSGTIICNNGAVDLNTGVKLDGRVLTTTGGMHTASVTAIIPPGCPNTSSPAIATQPIAQTLCAGRSVSFSVVATGTFLTYQWRKGTVNLTNVGNITGATSATLTMDPVNVSDAAADYNVIVSGTYAPVVTSGNAALVVDASPVPTISGQTAICAGSSISYETEPGHTNYQWNVSAGGTVTAGGNSASSSATVLWNVIGAQTVSVNYMNDAGCVAVIPASLDLIISNAVPAAAGTIAGLTTVCQGEVNVAYAVISITDAASYAWTIPTGASIISGTGTHAIIVNYAPDAVSGMIEVKGVNGCGIGAASSLSITVNLLPQTPVIIQTVNMLSSNAASGNQWYKNGVLIAGATAQSYDATSTGDYSAVITLAGCSSAASNVISVLFSGISTPVARKFDLSPVPNDGLFTASIVCPNQENFTLAVINNMGSLVYEKKNIQVNGSTKQVIDLRNLPSGMYTVIFTTGTNRIIRKMMVNR